MDIGMGRAVPVTAADSVRDAIGAWWGAAQRKDLAGIGASYAADVVSCDAIGDLRFVGREAVVAHWAACFAMCADSTMEMHDLRVEASGEVGFGHFTMECGGVGPDGVRQVGVLRGTTCLRREEGRWVIAHDHCSMPFDPMTGRVVGMPDAARAAA